jgi:glycosyltransferase involved in cell wall biosynthesis
MQRNFEADLVVLSHLRWTWVWQRPQHLVSRFAAMRPSGSRTWFVEEPVAADVEAPRLEFEEHDGVHRVWLEVPHGPGTPYHLGFDAPDAAAYPDLLLEHLCKERSRNPDVLLYTPMALNLARALDPATVAYDVMDDLATFRNAPEGLRLRQRRLLNEADVVFTGGRSLYEGVSRYREDGCHLFPSGVDVRHYAQSLALRERRSKTGSKVAGYVGVIDERLDLELVAGLASALPDWTIRMVGPVAKIDPETLPQASNIEYPGMATYAELPTVMAGFDVALMPFALNEATRSISPTKTLEYLAAGLPVVSTRVPDVVSSYRDLVSLADDAAGFASACHGGRPKGKDRSKRVSQILARHGWDAIAQEMAALMDKSTATASAEQVKGASA